MTTRFEDFRRTHKNGPVIDQKCPNTLNNPPKTQAGCMFPRILEKRDLFFVNGPLPLGEGGAQRRVREVRPTILNKAIHCGAGCPHPALSRHLLPVGEGPPYSFQGLLGQLWSMTAIPHNLRDRDFFREIHVLDRIQQSDAFLHRALERLST